MDSSEYVHVNRLNFPSGFGGDFNESRRELVVSRTRSGEVLSLFYNDVWNVSPYNLDQENLRFDFLYWLKGEIISDDRRRLIDEAKWIVYLMMWRRDGQPVSLKTVRHYMWVLNGCMRYALYCSISVKDIFCDQDHFLAFGRSGGYFGIKVISALCSALSDIDASEVGYTVLTSRVVKKLRKQLIRELDSPPYEQHPPIPIRIYSLILSNLLGELDEIEEVLDSYIEIIKGYDIGSGLLSYMTPQSAKLKSANLFKERIGRSSCRNYLSKRGVFNRKGVLRGVSDIYLVCKIIIHFFTGMRDGEVDLLEKGCVRRFDEFGKTHYIIDGYTTKMTGGVKKECKWIASIEAVRAIEVLERVSDAVKCSIKLAREYKSIFISPVLLKDFGCFHDALARKITVGLRGSKRVRGLCQFEISEEDLQELVDIDPFRDWGASSKFKVGAIWHVTIHQFRRSLALYASRSGLVTLPSLRRQLQHITEEMSRYYSSGYFFAKNPLDLGDFEGLHFATEYLNAQPESEAVSFIRNVLNSDERLYGGGGAWIDRNLKMSGSVLPLDTLNDIKGKFMGGEMNYSDTPVGGCLKKGDCEHRSYGRFVYCGTACAQGIVKLSKLDRVIEVQAKMVDSLPDGIAKRTEQLVLDEYCAVRDRIIAKG